MSQEIIVKCKGECGRELKLNSKNFHRKASGKHGFKRVCKICTSMANKKYRENNKTKAKAYQRENKKYLNEYNKKWRKKNKELTANYNVYAKKLFADDIKEDDGKILVKCKDNCDIYGKTPKTIIKQDMINAGHIVEDKHKKFYDATLLKTWSEYVRLKANNECEICGQTSDLEAHHIEPKATTPEKALDVSNGICLCSGCHKKFGHSSNGCTTGQLRKCDI